MGAGAGAGDQRIEQVGNTARLRSGLGRSAQRIILACRRPVGPRTIGFDRSTLAQRRKRRVYGIGRNATSRFGTGRTESGPGPAGRGEGKPVRPRPKSSGGERQDRKSTRLNSSN